MTTVAAIDCGTNSIRLLISDVSDSRPRDVVRTMEIVRLGEGIDTSGVIVQAALDRTATALRRYAELLAIHQPKALRMVATSASRDASNAAVFTKLVRDSINVDPEVITGDEEAALSFSGAVADLPPTSVPRLIVDIGGGSTEFVRGTATADAARSVNIGCVRMTERHLLSDPPTTEQITDAEADIGTNVTAALNAVDPDSHASTLVGLAGSVTTVAALSLGLASWDTARIHHARISFDEVQDITARLLSQTARERLSYPVMHQGRADVIAAGALVLRVIMERGNFSEVIASEHDILDGIAASIA